MGSSYQDNDSGIQKVALRRTILAVRRTLEPDVRARADAAIVAAVLAAVEAVATSAGRSPVTVAAYHPLPDEPGAGLPDRLAMAGHRVLLPILLPDNDLDWGQYTGEIVTGARRLGEPVGPRLGPAVIGRADVVLTPALAVGRTGTRLGRGGGSYDRALARVDAATPVVALLYDGEWPHEVPRQPHDRPVTAVVTPESGVVELAR